MQWVELTNSTGTVLQTLNTLEYQYPEPVREVVTRLRLFPLARRGAQRLLQRECEVSPAPDRTRRYVDCFGNEVREFRHKRVDERLRFEIGLLVEYDPQRDPSRTPVPRRAVAASRPALDADAFLQRSSLVDDSPELSNAAGVLAGAGKPDEERVDAIGQWVREVMAYQPNVTGVDTSASQALSGRQGVCQDFAHIMLALCRANGIPARYVSGFITGEGAMHAWVEALVEETGRRAPHWMGFDPTHNRRTDTQYVTVATGRDFADVSPVTGTFYGSSPGRLTSWSQTVARAPIS